VGTGSREENASKHETLARNDGRRRTYRFAAFRLFGTFAPAARASESPIAIACLRLLTLRPERPLFKVPALRFFIARPTLAEAVLEYFRALRAMKLISYDTNVITAVPEGSECFCS
jgi:hypothetical protein